MTVHLTFFHKTKPPVERLAELALSVVLAARHYRVVVHSNLTELADLGLPCLWQHRTYGERRPWSLHKIQTYALAGEHPYVDGPYLHIDADVFLHDPLPARLLAAPIFAQSVDSAQNYMGLAGMLPEWRRRFAPSPHLAFNCGIFGGNPDLVRKYAEFAAESAPAPPTYVEQLTLGRFCRDRGIQASVLVADEKRGAVGYTHLMRAKDSIWVQSRVAQRLLTESPEIGTRLGARGVIHRQNKFIKGRRVVCALLAAARDHATALRNIRWMEELGGCHGHDALIVVPRSMPREMRDSLAREARLVFASVEALATPFDLPDENWPRGANWLFANLCRWAYSDQSDFILIEPDAIPLKPGWLTALIAEYRACGKPYMGTVEPSAEGHPSHMPGNACYSWQTWSRCPIHALHIPWDVAMATEGVMEHVHETKLIHQIWGAMGKPPTFGSLADLSVLSPEAVLFHRNKDGTLIERLKEHATILAEIDETP